MTVFSGLYSATLTPFDESGQLDLGVVREHTQWLIEQGVEGLCPCGTTGEFLFLSQAEKIALNGATVQAAAGRVPVIVGVWSFDAAGVQELAKAARDAGADGVFLPTPIYYPASDDVILQWYTAAHEASGLPTFAYNIPGYAANSISNACLDQLLSAGIAGIKDSTGKEDRLTSLVQEFGERGTVFAASDGFALRSRLLGADGFISAIANVAPKVVKRAWDGDADAQGQIDQIRNVVKQFGGIPVLKYLATLQGFPFGGSRLPLSELSADVKETLETLTESDGVGEP
jgi:4-hydroxy-tetrahydrodipicolinate synthase